MAAVYITVLNCVYSLCVVAYTIIFYYSVSICVLSCVNKEMID